MEVPAKMRPAGSLADPDGPAGVWPVELLEAGIGIGLQDACKASQMAAWMLAFAVGREPVGGARRIAAGPGAVVTDIDPDPAFLDAAGAAAPAPRRVEHLDRRVIGMQAVRLHDRTPDPLAQRTQR